MVGWLKSTIVREVIGHFVDNEMTFDLWTIIINQYAAPLISQMLHYHRLLHITKKHGLTIDNYLLKMKDMAGKLSAAGDQVLERNLIMYVLGGHGYWSLGQINILLMKFNFICCPLKLS